MRINQVTLRSVATFLAIVCGPPSVRAQGHEVRAAVHYQWLHLTGTTFPAGVNGEVSAVVRTPLAAVAQIGWAPKQMQLADLSATARLVDFGAGVRLIPGRSRFRPFVQMIAGGVHLGVRGTVGSVSGSGSETWFQLEPGAGFNVDVGRKAAIAASVHVRRIFVGPASFEPPGENAVRALAGVSVQLFN